MAVLHLPQTKLSFLHILFYFLLSMNATICHHHPPQWLFLLSQIFIIIAIFSFMAILTHMPFSPAMVAYPIEFFIFILILFYFLIFFFFIIFIFRTSFISRFVAILTTLAAPLLVLFITGFFFSTFSSSLFLIFSYQ